MMAVAILGRGGLVAFPTETVYGLGGDAANEAAAAKIFAVKGRPRAHPLIVHLAPGEGGPPRLDGWAREIPDPAKRLVARASGGRIAATVPPANSVCRKDRRSTPQG